MCGIIAYIGTKHCKSIIINGLKRLEYRGYDSAGMAMLISDDGSNKNDALDKVLVLKQAGKIKDLEDSMKAIGFDSHIG
ncbi:MAG: hypothetical protein PHR39_05645, partial [Actinomycetota bacterium]|nr:hypothetical protein [Actinomycetota bacterium]